ncbi:MAG: DNA internalization-related competence protein ComEC/Rec2 [Gammaproteobacteria bacterium]|nr:DNA internalization-related competence protein ComEC/Rec2 [Gammaproteobacteria bacterium]
MGWTGLTGARRLVAVVTKCMAGRGPVPPWTWLAAAWLAGGALSLAGHHLFAIPWLLGAAGVALLSALWDRRAVLLVTAVLGALWVTWSAGEAMSERLAPSLAKDTLVVTGSVANLPRIEGRRIRFRFAVDSARNAKGQPVPCPRLIALSWYYPPSGTTLRTGERWRFAVRLKRPRSLADPAVFDYAGWALAHGIGAGGYVYDDRGKRVAPAAPGLNILRARIATDIASALPDSPYVGLVAGLAVGERGEVSEAQWQTLRDTGTIHLLSISGLHLAFGAFLVYFIALFGLRRLSPLVRRMPARIPAAGLAALAAIGYAALAGFAMATERSLIMLILPLFTLSLRRRVRIADTLALAAVAVILISPLALITASFWLSFGAVAALVYGLTSAHPAWGLIRAQIVVSLGIAPLLVAFFGQVSLIGPLANLIAIPYVSWLVVPVDLLGVMANLVHGGWGAPLFQLAALLLSWLWPVLEWFAALPHATFSLGATGWMATAAALVGVVFLIAPRGLGLRLAGAALLLPLLMPAVSRPSPGNYRVTVLDVGQGLATVVTTAHHTLLFDTGPSWWGGNNAGRTIVVPFLRAHRLGRPDRVIVSHGDEDHSGGLPAIRRLWPDVAVLTSAPELHGEPCLAGEHWRWDGVRFAILSPQPHAGGSDNNRSCVLKVSGAGGRALFPADIEAERERWLLRHDGARLQADLLVAPHHGSASSSTAGFVRAVHPDYVVFSTGFLNRYHFPRTPVVARYRHVGARLVNTAHAGAVTFAVTRDGGVRLISRYRPEHARPWTDH